MTTNTRSFLLAHRLFLRVAVQNGYIWLSHHLFSLGSCFQGVETTSFGKKLVDSHIRFGPVPPIKHRAHPLDFMAPSKNTHNWSHLCHNHYKIQSLLIRQMGSTFGEESAMLAMMASGEKARKRPGWSDTSQLCFGPRSHNGEKIPPNIKATSDARWEDNHISLTSQKNTQLHPNCSTLRSSESSVEEQQQR